MVHKKEMVKLTAALLVVLSLSFILAAGVTSPYKSAETPLKLASGESYIVILKLQNTNADDMIFAAKITSQEGVIATIVEDADLIYSVPKGSTDVPVKIKVEVPETMKAGDTGKVSVSFEEKSEGQEGMLDVSSSMDTWIDVQVVGEEESAAYVSSSEKPKTSLNIIFAIILVLVILACSILVIKKHNQSKKRK